jgi:ADP-heptose:LPS heptosyltransferase
VKPKLLVLELWGVGDLAIATPFLQAASRGFNVTLLAKSFAEDLRNYYWPEVRVVLCHAPWTAFRGKYRLYCWPWRKLWRLVRKLRSETFDFGVSVRRDPRDHLFLRLVDSKQRLSFPRAGSEYLLTRPLMPPAPPAHRYEHWRLLGNALGLDLPPLEGLRVNRTGGSKMILVHTGAAQAVRVWPLDRYANLIERLRQLGHTVQVAGDSSQCLWWQSRGERIDAPQNVSELIALVEQAALFIGNDSGPGHLAAISGVPTFTIFGPQLPALFKPIHPAAEWIEGGPCPHKPCFDNCRFAEPFCLLQVGEEEVFSQVEAFIKRHL